jgi:AcrR family transcriptional regulator
MADDLTRYDQKLEFILRTSARIFAEKGYHSTSMRDISRATNVSLAGLYHYCRSKDELLFLIQDNCFQRVLESARRRLAGASDPVEKLRIFIDNHLSFFAANMAEMKVLSHEADSLTGEMAERVSHTKRQYTFLARDILAEIQRTEAAPEQAVDLTVATYALFGMMNWIYNWYDPAGKLTVAELVGNLARLFITGFVSGNLSPDLGFGSVHREEPLSVWRIGDMKVEF